MSKERKLTDTDDFREGPESPVEQNNEDPWQKGRMKTVPGHGQGGKGHGPSGQAEGKGGRPSCGYGELED